MKLYTSSDELCVNVSRDEFICTITSPHYFQKYFEGNSFHMISCFADHIDTFAYVFFVLHKNKHLFHHILKTSLVI